MILQIIFILLLIVLLTVVLHIFILPVHIGIKGGFPFSSGFIFNVRWGIGVISGDVRDDLLTVRLYGFKVLSKTLGEEEKRDTYEISVDDSGKPEEKDSGEKTDYLKLICFLRDNLLTGELCSIIRLFDLESLQADIKIGLDDPEATGKVYGILIAISGYLYSCRNLSLNVYPSFEKPLFELFFSGWIKIRKIYRIMIFAVRIYLKMRSEGIIGEGKVKKDDRRRGDYSGNSKARGEDNSSKVSECPV